MQADTFRSGDYVIAAATRRLLRDGTAVELEAKVFDLILLLVRNHERALGKQEIIEALWGRRPITDAALSQLIYKARRACGDDGERQAVIRTIYGRGLQWVAPVQEIDDAQPVEATPAADETAATAGTTAGHAAHRHRSAWLAAAVVIVVLAAVGVGGWLLLPRLSGGARPAAPRIALLPIENATGETSLDWSSRGVPGLMGSLLADSPGIEVIDPLQVARAWGYTPARGESHAAHVRAVTHASLLVSGKLRKLAGLYELDLHLDPGTGRAGANITLAGPEPGALAVAAVPRLRHALKLRSEAPSALGPTPRDAYLAQTFARGMDAAMHGRWQDAKPYFSLVAQGEPDFLPGRYRLGQSQLRTGQMEAAGSTLQAVLADAKQRDNPNAAALALKELAYGALMRHDFDDAVALGTLGVPFARRARNPGLEADLAIHAAQAHASLRNNDAAVHDLDTARTLIDRHDLRQLEPALYGAEIFVANGRNDFPAVEKAARESLAVNQELGDERGSAISLFNIAYAMENRNRRVEALPLWAKAWRWGRDHHDYDLEARAGWYLASGLFNSGLDERADKINAAVLDAARRHDDRSTQSLALQLRAGLQWLRGEAGPALRSCREASKLIDGGDDPAAKLEAWSPEVFVALAAEPGAIAGITRQADGLIAAQPAPSAHRFRKELFRAAGAAARGDTAKARAALEAARAAAGSEIETGEARQFALNIALATGDVGSSAIALRDLDLTRISDTVFLQLAAQWAARQGDLDLGRRVAQRQATLRQAALDALRNTDLDVNEFPPAKRDS